MGLMGLIGPINFVAFWSYGLLALLFPTSFYHASGFLVPILASTTFTT